MMDIAATDSFGLFEMIARSTLTAKFVLVLLFIFSVASWAIILSKFYAYRKAKVEDARFLKVFSINESLINIYNYSKGLAYSPLARVFLTGYHELYMHQKETAGKPGERPPLTPLDLKGINLALNKSINSEIEKLGHRLDFLATTGSTTPFIGLFGTVWGIMHSFRIIGLKGTASIGGVAPGIAEALIATAAGLVAAIPAVVFYNYLNARIRVFSSRMTDFSQDFTYMVEKDFTK